MLPFAALAPPGLLSLCGSRLFLGRGDSCPSERLWGCRGSSQAFLWEWSPFLAAARSQPASLGPRELLTGAVSLPLQFQNSPEPDLEIVVCSGYGKNGALSVLQVCARPCASKGSGAGQGPVLRQPCGLG